MSHNCIIESIVDLWGEGIMQASDGLAAYREALSNRKGEDILRAALQTFRTNGYHNAAMAEIARDANVSTATLYKHSVSKENLFAMCVEGVHAVGLTENAVQKFLGEVARGDLASINLPKDMEIGSVAVQISW